MKHVTKDGSEIAFEMIGPEGAPLCVWGHGWGQDHKALMSLADSLSVAGAHILVDFPGFGDSPVPSEVWSTAEYADAVADLIRAQKQKPVTWIGHSFGGRVGIQLAARHPDLVKDLILIAGAGLKPRRSLWKRCYIRGRVGLFKTLKCLLPEGPAREKLYKLFGSTDYKSAGPLRAIFVKVVNEDLSEQAAKIKVPALLIYGENDCEAPPEIGERLSKLIGHAEMVHLPGQDHYSVLSTGRHIVAPLIKNFLQKDKAAA